MRYLALTAIALTLIACDRSTPESKSDETAAAPEAASTANQAAAPALKSNDYLVIERLPGDAPFPTYRTHHISVAPDGYDRRSSADGFRIEANGSWEWVVEEKLVEGARDCSCETFKGGRGSCSPDATLMVASLRPAGEGESAKAWEPPLYQRTKTGAAAWRTESAQAWLQGDILFTSVCVHRVACGDEGESGRTCESVALDLSGETPRSIPLDSFGGAADPELVTRELAGIDAKDPRHAPVQKAIEAGTMPRLAEVRPRFDGTVRRRWVVPTRYNDWDSDWSDYEMSLWDERPAGTVLATSARIPRPVSIFTPTLEGEMAGWTDGSLVERDE